MLTSKNNRLVWGGMIALANITNIKPAEVFATLNDIAKTIEKGSVITIDCGVEILAKLGQQVEYIDKTEPLLLDQLWKCPIKQLPQYMEKAVVSITSKNKEIYQKIINERITECERDTQVKRLQKVLKKIDNH